jgi:hypothetical protein
MSEYIIDPSWFYWTSVFQGIKVLLLIIGVTGTLGLGIGTGVALLDIEWDELKKSKLYWVGWIVSLLALVGGLFAPSKEVMMQMMVARYLTHENIAYSVETIKEIADYILQAVGK